MLAAEMRHHFQVLPRSHSRAAAAAGPACRCGPVCVQSVPADRENRAHPPQNRPGHPGAVDGVWS